MDGDTRVGDEVEEQPPPRPPAVVEGPDRHRYETDGATAHEDDDVKDVADQRALQDRIAPQHQQVKGNNYPLLRPPCETGEPELAARDPLSPSPTRGATATGASPVRGAQEG